MRPSPTRGFRLLLFVAVIGLPTWVAAQDGQMDFVDGEVWIESSGGRQRADFGSPVSIGDLVTTGPDGVAVVRVGQGAQIKLRENSIVEIRAAGTAGSVNLQQGGLFARVDRRVNRTRSFEVTTPTTVAGVRGTEFFMAYGRTVEDQPDVWLCVNEGAVEVVVRQSGSTTVVEEGQGINILAGARATDPRFFPWTTELNWNFDPAAGEVRDDTDLDGAYSDLLDQDYD